MTSRYETEIKLENKPTLHLEERMPASSEAAYDRLTGYGFARRYVGGKIVADVGWEEIGYGSCLLAQTAESVTGLTNSCEAVNLASAAYSAPNVSYRRVNLPELPLPEGYFDVVVALGLVESLEHQEDLVTEVKRILKREGVLVISALDRQANAGGHDRRDTHGWREMYIPEFRELLERHFRQVHVYRQGAVAGGFVFPTSEEVTVAPVESARFSLTNPDLGTGPPTTRSVIAVCSDAQTLRQEEQPYLLLDRDRRLFDECEEHAEDIELMRDEIQQMQETEVQAFLEAIKLRRNLIFWSSRLPSVLRSSYARAHLRYAIHAIKSGESRKLWWLTYLYRLLRAQNRN